ncbi:Glycosyltransferase involved in cell wall bisynthesis [Algoriphagus hitonicola]|uniref:Glycosyltransferase involved in cell wall bisynthesis n=2 Tax=Algoriphagus hitonicola TaxID=435880 RepID=A0A1I2TKN4_9BACT|nr:Glycosyltransferase involved in cell wall bisynthesis [Algoriphagus hitonicola]
MVFREQARVLQGNYSYTFLSFKKIGIKEFFKIFRFIYFKEYSDTQRKEKYVYIFYLYSSFFGDFFNNWIELMAVKKAKKYFSVNNLKFNLIHAQSLIDSGVFAFYLKRKLGIPYIITEHAQINMTGISVRRHKFLQSVLNQANKRMVVSHHKIAQYASNRLYGDFEVIGNMVDESNFCYRGNKNKSEIFRIITVGAYTPIKDQATLLKALQLLDGLPLPIPMEFHWAGFNGWMPGKDVEVNKIIDLHNFQQIKVKLSGKLNRKEIAEAYRESDLFIFSSLAEGMPLAVMEALACGLPVITTRWGGVEEIIHSDNGRIVELKDYCIMSKEILQVANTPDIFVREKIAASAIQQFGSKAFKEKIASIYKNVLYG